MVEYRGEDKKKRLSKKDWIVGTAILLLITIAVSIGIFFKFGRDQNPIPINIRQNITFTPYYPTKLPKGWYIDTSSFKTSDEVILYKIVSKSSGDVLSISLQSIPGDFDYTTFYKQSVKKSVKFSTAKGTAVVGQAAGKPFGSLVTKDTWMITTTLSTRVSQNDVRQVLENLKN